MTTLTKNTLIIVLILFLYSDAKPQNFPLKFYFDQGRENINRTKRSIDILKFCEKFSIQKKTPFIGKHKIDSIMVAFLNGNYNKLVFSYDEKNLISSMEFFGKLNNSWRLHSRVRYIYDSLSNITNYFYDLWADNWFNYLWEKREYNEKGERTISRHKIWDNSGWENDSQVFSIIDSVNEIRSEITQNWINNSWVNSTKISTDLFPENLKEKKLMEIWDNNAWQYDMLQDIVYDKPEKIKSVITRKWDGLSWNNYVKANIITSKELEVMQVYQIWEDEKWNDAERYIYNTDATGWFLNGRYEIFEYNTWIPGEGNLSIYNPDGFELNYLAKGIDVYYASPLDVKNETSVQIKDFNLSQNYPNPFNPSTVINYSIFNEGRVTLTVFDMLGRQVQKLVDEYKPAGNYSVNFNAANLPSGVYFYKLTTNNKSSVNKMQLIK